jgi:hypothetical protein
LHAAVVLPFILIPDDQSSGDTGGHLGGIFEKYGHFKMLVSSQGEKLS